MRTYAIRAAIFFAMLLFPVTLLHADCFGGYYGYGTWHGYSSRSIYQRTDVPYFAMNPPVYYSRAVPRPYGYSPFAYPPGVMTPEPAPQRSVIIGNRHIAPTVAPAQMIATPQPTPLRIINPYVK